MTIEEATENAMQKAKQFHAAKRTQARMYQAHCDAAMAAKTASDLWMSAGTETGKAEREWQTAQTELSGAILAQSHAAFTR